MVVDEFQHFVDKGSQKIQHHVADWLKVLLDESEVAVVVAGLETSMAVLYRSVIPTACRVRAWWVMH